MPATNAHLQEQPPYDTCGHHSHPTEEEPAISQSWKWIAVGGNAANGIMQLLAGNLSTLSVAENGLHDLSDASSYYIQSESLLNRKWTDEKRAKMRKASYWIIAASSLGASAKAGVDLGLDHEGTPHAAAIYTAGASLALNGLLLARLRQGMRRRKSGGGNVHEHDLSKHFWKVDMPSAGLAVAGATLQKYSVDVEQLVAILSGGWGAYVFRPTKANLSHNCLTDLLGSSTNSTRKIQKGWLHRAAYKPRHSREPYRPRHSD